MCPRAMDEMSKQGLYFWLRSVVDTGRCPGVTWIDKANGVFQIPWSNQKSRSWQKEDSSVFLEYAKHTSKYKPGDKMDFPKWKQNLKSAINKNRYIERLRGRDHLSGPKPYRVYRFMEEKTEKRRSSDDFPDAKEETANCMLQACLYGIDNFERLPVSSEVLLTQNDLSTSGTVVYFDSGTRSSGSSPFSTASAHGGFPLSPDIARSDSCDHPPGNIPTFVSAYCDAPADQLFGDESLNTLRPDSTLSDPVQAEPSSTGLATGPEINQYVVGSEFNPIKTVNPFVELEGNDSQSLLPLQILVNKTMQEGVQPVFISNVNAGGSSDIVPIRMDSQALLCAKLRHDTNQVAEVIAEPMSVDPVTLQLLVSKTGQLLNPSHTVPLAAGLPLPVANLQSDASKNYRNQPSMRKQVSHEVNCRDTVMVEETATSLPELRIYGDSTVPSSMDTYDTNYLSGSQNFQGSQFSTYRNDQKPEASMKALSIPPSIKTITDDSVMHVQVLYGTPHRTVKKITITSRKSSCRLFYGSVNCSVMQKAIQGQQDAEEVELPSVDTPDHEYHDEEKKTAIRKILKDMELGIVISYSDNDIFVERRCLPRVYISDGVSKSESLPRSTKKRPDVKTLAFDYNKHFKECLQMNKINNHAVPKDHFLLTIGYQILANDDSPTRMVPVYIVVRHVKAAMERFHILGASTVAPNPMCSDPNSFDKDIQLFKDIDIKN